MSITITLFLRACFPFMPFSEIYAHVYTSGVGVFLENHVIKVKKTFG